MGKNISDLGKRALDSFIKLNEYIIKNDFKGYEFDDFLGSPIIRFLSFGNLFLKRVFIQVGEISPINFRKILFIKKLDSYKARAFFAEGSAIMYEITKEDKWKELVIKHLIFLKENHNKNYQGYSWGNHFDFASRGGFFPKFIPTIVWTSKIADAAYISMKIIPEIESLCNDIVEGASKFIISELERIEDSTGICFAYAPGLVNPIHNSNLLGAATLAKYYERSKNLETYDLINKSLNWSLSRMNSDGSWYYGDSNKYKWIDNFHTAYNLDCLMDIYEIDNNLVNFEYIERTFNFWVNNFFTEEGICKYYHNKTYPIDIQSIAQAIETLSKVQRYFPDSKITLMKVVEWCLKYMQNSNGSFYYQIRKLWKNKIPYIHWGQSTMFAALSHFLKMELK